MRAIRDGSPAAQDGRETVIAPTPVCIESRPRSWLLARSLRLCPAPHEAGDALRARSPASAPARRNWLHTPPFVSCVTRNGPEGNLMTMSTEDTRRSTRAQAMAVRAATKTAPKAERRRAEGAERQSQGAAPAKAPPKAAKAQRRPREEGRRQGGRGREASEQDRSRQDDAHSQSPAARSEAAKALSSTKKASSRRSPRQEARRQESSACQEGRRQGRTRRPPSRQTKAAAKKTADKPAAVKSEAVQEDAHGEVPGRALGSSLRAGLHAQDPAPQGRRSGADHHEHQQLDQLTRRRSPFPFGSGRPNGASRMGSAVRSAKSQPNVASRSSTWSGVSVRGRCARSSRHSFAASSSSSAA